MRDRRWFGVLALVLTAAACGSSGATGAGGPDAGGGSSAAGSGGSSAAGAGGGGGQAGGIVADCALAQPFRQPVQIVPSAAMTSEHSASVSADGLTAIVASQQNYNIAFQILTAYSRRTLSEMFADPQPLAGNIGSLDVRDPRVSRDGLAMYFNAVTPSQTTIWVAPRPSVTDPFGPFSKLPATVNSATGNTHGPWISSDGGRLYFERNHALHVSTITAGQFDTAVAVSELNAGGTVLDPVLTDDELTIYFASEREIGTSAPSSWRVVTSRRASRSAPWDPPSYVSELDEGVSMIPTHISPDGCLLYVGVAVDSYANRIKQAAKPPL